MIHKHFATQRYTAFLAPALLLLWLNKETCLYEHFCCWAPENISNWGLAYCLVKFLGNICHKDEYVELLMGNAEWSLSYKDIDSTSFCEKTACIYPICEWKSCQGLVNTWELLLFTFNPSCSSHVYIWELYFVITVPADGLAPSTGTVLNTKLTHWGLVTPFGEIDLGHHWLR